MCPTEQMLFNHISGSNVFSKDLLFATLDPTMRKIKLPSGNEIILSDTVGFISDLPHELVMSFRATLEEVLEADIIVHVRDISNVSSKEQRTEVIHVLHSLGLEHIENKENYIEVLNKSDLLEPGEFKGLTERCNKSENMILTSALTGFGVDNLLEKIDEILRRQKQEKTFRIAVSNGALYAYIYKNAEVLSSKTQGEFIVFKIKADAAVLAKIEKMNK